MRVQRRIDCHAILPLAPFCQIQHIEKYMAAESIRVSRKTRIFET